MLTSDPLVAELLELAGDAKKRSKTARLQDIAPAIEAALASGVPRIHVVQALKNHGIDMTLGTFTTTLRRIRIKNGRAVAPATPAAVPLPNAPGAQAASVEGIAKSAEGTSGSDVQARSLAELSSTDPTPPYLTPLYDPRDIDRILATPPDMEGLSRIARQAKLAKKGIK